MFQRQPPQPEPPKFEPSDIYDRLQIYSNLFFLSACSAGGILAVNVARINPKYFWLIVIATVAAIATLAFFPDASNQKIRRIGILAVGIGVLLANWEFISTFQMQPAHILIALCFLIVILAALGAVGGNSQ